MNDAHHRFSLRGKQGQLAVDVEAVLSAPWTVLFGPSGSGKSTVLRAIAGLLPDLTNSFERWNAPSQSWRTLVELAPERRGLAFAPQEAPLLPHLSVEDNLRFPEALRHISSSRSCIPEILHLLKAESLLHKRGRELSGGERQRVSLGRALAVPEADLLLLDEPFAGLDRSFRDELLPSLQIYLAARSLPVLSVTHDPDEALLLQADVLRLQEGRLVAQGAARQVLADEVARLSALLLRPISPSL